MGKPLAKPEVAITLLMVAATVLLGAVFHLPFVIPTSNSAMEVEIHYIYPLVGIAVLGGIACLRGRQSDGDAMLRTFYVGLPCYALVLLCHFNVKLWIPHINPLTFDSTYIAVDRHLHLLVDVCFQIRRFLLPVVPFQANFYMISFIALFYASFAYHALVTPERFRELFLAVLLMQVIGTFAYLMMPAVGPFIYQPGVNPIITEHQQWMYGFYRESVAHGPEWLARHGGSAFTAGLAAMPSLHTAGSLLFFLFAWKHGRLLVPFFGALLFYIVVTSIASRWHYLVDLPAGALVAWVSLKLAERLAAPSERAAPARVPSLEPTPVLPLKAAA